MSFITQLLVMPRHYRHLLLRRLTFPNSPLVQMCSDARFKHAVDPLYKSHVDKYKILIEKTISVFVNANLQKSASNLSDFTTDFIMSAMALQQFAPLVEQAPWQEIFSWYLLRFYSKNSRFLRQRWIKLLNC